jgi:release factor glutamine methyltransferase
MNAELLLMFTLSCDRAYLFAHPERELTGEEASRYQAALAKRSRGVPAQYITGHQEFWGMDLIVTPAVLIPRPETEHVIEAVLELEASGPRRNSDLAPQPSALAVSEVRIPRSDVRIVDVGTGSGCIALARANAARHQLEHRVRFRQSDLLEGLPGEFDFVVSNPPYVGESEEDSVQLEVRRFEPRGAVFAGPKGTEVIARLIPKAQAALRPSGWLVMEISGTIAQDVRELLHGWQNLEIKPDLESIPRVAMAQRRT